MLFTTLFAVAQKEYSRANILGQTGSYATDKSAEDKNTGSALMRFNGKENDRTVHLQWSLDVQNKLTTVVVERSFNNAEYTSLAEFWMNTEEEKFSPDFKFADKNIVKKQSIFYRLKLEYADGGTEYSDVLVFKGGVIENNLFRIYPTVINGSATLNVSVKDAEVSELKLIDYSGRVAYTRQIQLLGGINTIRIAGLNNLPTGNYLAILKTSDKVYSQKVIMQ